MNVTFQSPQKIVLSFSYDASLLAGRVGGVAGSFSFEFLK